MENAFLVLDTALEAKVLANKDESKCLKPLIAVIRPVRDRHLKNAPASGRKNKDHSKIDFEYIENERHIHMS